MHTQTDVQTGPISGAMINTNVILIDVVGFKVISWKLTDEGNNKGP